MKFDNERQCYVIELDNKKVKGTFEVSVFFDLVDTSIRWDENGNRINDPPREYPYISISSKYNTELICNRIAYNSYSARAEYRSERGRLSVFSQYGYRKSGFGFDSPAQSFYSEIRKNLEPFLLQIFTDNSAIARAKLRDLQNKKSRISESINELHNKIESLEKDRTKIDSEIFQKMSEIRKLENKEDEEVKEVKEVVNN